MTVKQLVKKLKIHGDLKTYIIDSIEFFKDNGIEPLTINLQKDLYPYLSGKYGTTENGVKSKFIRELKKFNEDNPLTIKSYFGVTHKITVKKLLILILMNIK